jgi:hypothetical protein
LTPSEAAAKFGSQLAASVSRFKVFNWIIIGFTRITGVIGLSAAVVLLLFVLHQLFLWVDQDPETAFERAAFLLEVVELGWDTLGVLVNSVIDVSNAALIPIWNAYTFYVVEPVVILVLEVFSVIFFSHHYEGVIDEAGFPYQGLDCTSSVQAMAWCGRYHAYEQALINDESGFVNKSQIFLGLGTARRLSELSGVGEFATPSFEIDGVTDALTQVGTLAIVAAAPLADVAAAILDDVIVSSASAIFDAVFLLLKSLLETFKMLVKSGLLTFAVGVGVDFLVIYYLYYQLPLFLAGLDFIMCMVDFFFPSGWGEQLRCAESNCFTGPSAMTDLLIFTSVPVVLKQFGTILEVTLNSGTGRRCAHSGVVVCCRHALGHHTHLLRVVAGSPATLPTTRVVTSRVSYSLSTRVPRSQTVQAASSARCDLSTDADAYASLVPIGVVHAVSGSEVCMVGCGLRLLDRERVELQHVPGQCD